MVDTGRRCGLGRCEQVALGAIFDVTVAPCSINSAGMSKVDGTECRRGVLQRAVETIGCELIAPGNFRRGRIRSRYRPDRIRSPGSEQLLQGCSSFESVSIVPPATQAYAGAVTPSVPSQYVLLMPYDPGL